jgi:hypothetical protein
MSIIEGIYLSALILYWILGNKLPAFPVSIFLVQSIVILIPSLYYFFELFRYPETHDLMNEPAFWITTSFLFYFSGTIPLFWAQDYVFNEQGIIIQGEAYIINFICYGIMFLLITRAYLCNKKAM